MRLTTLLGLSVMANVALGALLLLRRPEAVGERVVEVPSPAGEAEPPPPALASEAPASAKPAPRPPPTDLRTALGREPTPEEAAEYETYFAQRVRAGPADFAALLAQRRRDAEEQARRSAEAAEDVQRGGLLGVIEAQRTRDAPIHSFVESPDFEEGFRPRTKAATHRLPVGTQAPDQVDDGDLIQFLPGAHSFSVKRWRNKPFPRDLTFEGYGMDETLVTFDEFHDPAGAIVNLTFRDMTVDCGNKYLFDVRSKDGTVRFERCRIVRFDMGAGGSLLFGVEGLAVWMSGCRIEVGFGRNPPYGNVFRSSDPLLARLEDTTVVGAHLGYGGEGTSIVLRRCRFETAPPGEKARMEKAAWLRSVETTVEESPVPLPSKTRPLAELNSTWATADAR